MRLISECVADQNCQPVSKPMRNIQFVTQADVQLNLLHFPNRLARTQVYAGVATPSHY